MSRSAMSVWLAIVTANCILLALPARASAQDASIVRVTRVDGTVTRNVGPLREGDVIGRDERIVTGPGSAAVLTWTNGCIVEIYPGTTLVMKGVVFEGEKKLEKTFLSLERGRVFAKAQVPEHLFGYAEIGVGGLQVMTQGAELGIRYDDTQKQATVWSLLGVIVADTGGHRVRIEDGQQVTLQPGVKPGSPVVMPEGTRDALLKTSKRLGGSLLIEEEAGSPGGPLQIKIGGVKNRRGSAPYTVKFKAIVRGGTGRIKAINWSLGDGKGASGKEVQHTFTQGVYVVVLQAEDENGQKASAQLNISVEEDCGC